MSDGYVLGIWDGHDAGAALIHRGNVVFAVNEERLSRRKLEVGFPVLSIKSSLAYAGIGPRSGEGGGHFHQRSGQNLDTSSPRSKGRILPDPPKEKTAR